MGGGNCLFGTTVGTTTPIFRGNRAVVEVASEASNPTKLPDMEPLQAGKIDVSVTRYFDLFCVGKCTGSSDLKLNIQSANKIPELITKNAAGEPVFAEPTSMCTIKGLAGHNVWINVELNTITTKASNYMALGIKKRGEEDYYNMLYAGNSSRYVDILETDVVELIPLASSTPLSTKYTAVKAGDTAKITGASSYDFGSVYRVRVTLHNSQWIKVPCDLNELNSNGAWENNGHIGFGLINGKSQLLAVNVNGQLASSINGIHWIDAGSVSDSSKSSTWAAGLSHGNGIWCAVSLSGNVVYSIDEARSWRSSSAKISENIYATFFHGGVFIAASERGDIWTSVDAEQWNQASTISVGSVRILGYGNNRWICGGLSGNLSYSKNGNSWMSINSNLADVSQSPHGAAYVSGNFYAIDAFDSSTNSIIKSLNGEKWANAFDLNCADHVNITGFDNKLYLLHRDGAHCHIGLFRPDGTIDEM